MVAVQLRGLQREVGMSCAHAYFDGQRGHVLFVDEHGRLTEITTMPAHAGRVIQVDDGRHYPPILFGGGQYGAPLRWGHDTATLAERLAHDCRAKLYARRAAYDRAVAKERSI
jgi:hypothetical protein